MQRPPGTFQNAEKDLQKRKPNSNFSWVVKNSSKFCLYLVYFFLNIICWRFLVPGSAHCFVDSETWSWKTLNTSKLSMFVYYKTSSFCLILQLSHALVCSVPYQGFQCFCRSTIASSFFTILSFFSFFDNNFLISIYWNWFFFFNSLVPELLLHFWVSTHKLWVYQGISAF